MHLHRLFPLVALATPIPCLGCPDWSHDGQTDQEVGFDRDNLQCFAPAGHGLVRSEVGPSEG